MNKETVRKYVLFLGALLCTAFGIALVTKAGLGTTPISSIPWVLSLFLPLTIGIFTLFLNLLQIGISLILMGKEQIKAHHGELLLLLPVTVLFGLSIDLSMWLLDWFVPQLYVTKCIAALLGCVIMALGVTGEVKANVVMMAGEYLVRAIVNRIHREFGIIKLIFDASNVAIACIISICFMHGLYGIREGTVLAALIVGPLTHVMLPYFRVFDGWLQVAPAPAGEGVFKPVAPFVITISREFGSGGRQLAQLISQKLGIAYYDKELIALAAQDSNLTEDYVERIEQTAPTNFLMSLIMHDYEVPLERSLSTIDRLFVVQSRTIRHLAALGDCVIVGRCADRVLSDYPSERILRIFCCTDMASARRRCINDYGMNEENIEKIIAEKNRQRINHYQHFTGRRWGDAHNYDIVVNTGSVDMVLAVDMIADIYKEKIGQLRVEPDRS